MNPFDFTIGLITGVAIMILNRWSVKKAVDAERSRSDALREENRRMRDELINFSHASDCRDAYHRGKQDGRKDPMTQTERFARNFEGKKVEFRGGRSA